MIKLGFKRILVFLGSSLILLSVACSDEEGGTISFESTGTLSIVSVSPSDGATDVSESSEMYFEFDRKIDMDSVSVNSSDSTCSGTFQISSDEFQTCVRHSASPSLNDDGTIVYLSADDFNGSTTYKYKVTGGDSGIKASDGSVMDGDYESTTGFTTYSGGGGPAFYALDFDGVNEHLQNPSDVLLGFSEPFTIGIWFKVNATGPAKSILHIKKNAVTNNSIHLFIDTNSKLRLELYDNVNNFTDQRTFSSLSGQTQYFCAIGVNPPSNFAFYINGISDGADQVSNSLGAPVNNDFRTIYVASNASLGNRFDGQIHAIAIWSSELLNPEITEIYNNGSLGYDISVSGTNYVSSGFLQHWWKFGEDQTFFAKDYKGTIDLGNGANMSSDDIVTYP